MTQMISAAFVEKEVIQELGINSSQGRTIQKMQIDSKNVKVVADIGNLTVDFVLNEKNPKYTITSGKFDENDNNTMFRHMKRLTNAIFFQDGDGLYDYDDEGNAEIKEDFVVTTAEQDLDLVEGDEHSEDIEQNNFIQAEEAKGEEQEQEKETAATSENTTHIVKTENGNIELTNKEIENIVDDIFGTEDAEGKVVSLDWEPTI